MLRTICGSQVDLQGCIPRLIAAYCTKDIKQEQESWRAAIEAEKALKKVGHHARLPM